MSVKRALVVGNNYPGTSAQLAGCVNDAWDWSALLTSKGYEVEVLLEATLVQVHSKLTELVSKSKFGDRLVFTFSGHGTWIPDMDGDELDGRDEALVMADYAQGGVLTDDQLQKVFSQLRLGAGALVLSDSCHSGTVARFAPSSAPRGTEEDRGLSQLPKFLSPAEFMDMSRASVAVLEAAPASTPRRTASLISGCGDLEYSWDSYFFGRPNGAFTRNAIDLHEDGISLNAWFRRIRQALPSTRHQQSPQLTATRYRKYARAL